MIVIFVPSPPHHLLFSTVPLALPPSSSPRLPGCVPSHWHSHTNLRLWALREGERDLSFSFSFLRPETGRHAETGRTQKFLLVPFTLFFLLVPLARARVSRLTPTFLSACHSPSYRLSLARSFSPFIQRFPSIRPKGFAPVSIFVVPCLSARAEEGSSPRASVGRPRTAYLCVRRIQTATIIVTFVGDDAQNDRPLRTSETNRPRAFVDLAESCSFNFSKFMYLHDSITVFPNNSIDR